jgi:glutathione synthase
MLRDGNIIEVENGLSELGLYSCLFIENNDIILNENFGTLMRTKGSHSNEGGVNSGFSVIDAPVLYRAEGNKVSSSIPANV